MVCWMCSLTTIPVTLYFWYYTAAIGKLITPNWNAIYRCNDPMEDNTKFYNMPNVDRSIFANMIAIPGRAYYTHFTTAQK